MAQGCWDLVPGLGAAVLCFIRCLLFSELWLMYLAQIVADERVLYRLAVIGLSRFLPYLPIHIHQGEHKKNGFLLGMPNTGAEDRDKLLQSNQRMPCL